MAASSTFGCILRDHNRRDFCRESMASQKNVHGMVTCINISQDSKDIEQRTERRSLNLSGGKQQKDAVQELSSPQNFGKSRVLDRWAARQAQDVISTFEKHGNDAELAIGSVTVPSQKEPAATKPENLGASTLVQMWEARLGISPGSNRTPKCSNDDPPRKSEVVEPYEESRFSHEGSIGDWEPDQITHEAPPPSSFSSTSSSSSLEPDTGMSLRTPRVADIIRRLTSAGDENDNESCINAGADSPSLERELSVGSNRASEQRSIIVQMTNSPRLRSRQAFQDLLMHMERDRQREIDTLVERQAVSRFSQKGRIQSMLRLKVLQRHMGVHLQDQQQRQRSSGSADGSNTSNSSSFALLREKFKVTSSPHSGTKREDVKGSSTEPQTQTLSQSCHSCEDSISSNCETSIASKDHQVEEIQDTLWQISFSKQDQTRDKELKVEMSLNSKVTCQESNSEAILAEDHLTKSGLNSPVTFQETCFEAIPAENLCKEKNLTSNDTYQDNDLEDNSIPLLEQQESFSLINGCWYEEGSEEDEEQESNMDEESVISEYDDYFLGVSRPRSFWEDRRQARYQDVLDTVSEHSDIRRLLERRRVSTYLASDFRVRMDSLMVCHLQRQNHHMGDQEVDMSSSDERMDDFLSSLVQCRSQSADHREDREEDEEEEDAIQVREAEVVPVEGDCLYSECQRISNKMEENKPQNEDRDCLKVQKRTEEESFDMGLEEGKCKEYVEEKEHELEVGQLEEKIDVGKGNISIEDDFGREVRNDEMMDDMEDGEEEESLMKYEEAREYFNRSNSSSFRMRSPTYTDSWSYRSCETKHTNLQPVALTSLPEPFNSNSYDHDAGQHMNSIDRLSMEIELINDLRKQMKMLHQEMGELRNSIYSCMDMQAKLQYSLENEMNSVRGEKANQNASRKDMCCVCNEMQVNSLL